MDGVVLGVGEVVAYLRALLDSDTVLGDLWVRGEVSNLSRSGAGHTYFTLKDEAGQLRCVMFRGSSLGAQDLQQGTRALVHGRVSLYDLQDVLRVLAARFPAAEVVLSPCLGQGEGAPAQIVADLERLDGLDGVCGVD